MTTVAEGAKLVRVHPEKVLEFPLVLYSSVTCPLMLENITSTTVAFKIKTTAPRGYLVRPSSGIISPSQTKEVQIILQPLQSVEQASQSHRFLIQTTLCDNNVEQLPKDFWQEVNKEQIFEHRLSVIFKQDTPTDANPGSIDLSKGSLHPGSQPASSSIITNQSVHSGDVDLKNKYDELVQYCLALEKQSNELKGEAAILREKLEKAERNVVNNSTQGAQGIEFWHVIAMVFVAIVALKLINY
ncbi:MSP domain-containing protein [Cryptosporidium serpentis]